jgi:Transposase DDE domain group 1
MTYSATRRLRFEFGAGVPVQAAFDAGRLTSDGGLVWLAEVDRSLGVCDALAACIPEWRHRPLHSLPTLVRQRIFQIAYGYADQNDADTLRSSNWAISLIWNWWPKESRTTLAGDCVWIWGVTKRKVISSAAR